MKYAIWAVVLLLAFAVGCGDDSSGADDGAGDLGADADADAESGVESDAEGGLDADADVVTGSVSVLVTFVDWPGDPVAAPDVVVAFDAPDGTRSEAPSGSDGRVSFDVSDWSAGTAAVTAFAEGRQMVSRVGIDEGDGEIALQLRRLGSPLGFVSLSGTATNMPYADATLGVGTTVPSVMHFFLYSTPGTDWTVPVPPDSPCTLVATARTSAPVPSGRGFDGTMDWAMVEQTGVSADTVVAMDFVANAVTPTIVHGSFPFPTRSASPLRGLQSYGWLWVTSKESRMSGYLGDVVRVDATADGMDLEYDAHYIVPPDAVSPVTCYYVQSDGDGRYQSAACEDGWPVSGLHDPGFLDAPILLTTGTTGAPHPLFEPVAWDLFDNGVHVALLLARERSRERSILFGVNGATKTPTDWVVLAPDDATSLTVPEPPSTTAVGDVLGTGYPHPVGFLQIWRSGVDGIEYAKVALSDTFVVQP